MTSQMQWTVSAFQSHAGPLPDSTHLHDMCILLAHPVSITCGDYVAREQSSRHISEATKTHSNPKRNCFNNAPCCFVLCFAVQLSLLARQLLKSRTSWPSWLSTCQETRLCSRRWQHKLAAMHTRYTALLPRHSGPHEGLFGCRGLGSAAKAGFNLCRATQVYSSCIFTAHGEVIAPPGQQRSQQLDRLRLSPSAVEAQPPCRQHPSPYRRQPYSRGALPALCWPVAV